MRRLAPMVMLLVLLGGCAMRQGPETVVVQPAAYADAFATTQRILRDEGLTLALRDPRSGVIEAGPVGAASMFEPWRRGHGSFDASLESTIHHQRHRVRVEFSPRNGSSDPSLDLTMSTEPIAVRAHAWIDREYRPGGRRNLWSRRLSDETVVYAPGETEQPADTQFWLPVHRDAEYESHLMALLADALQNRDSEPGTN